MALMEVGLDDKYRLDAKRIFLSGTQALVRLPMLQRERDRAQGLNTAGFISGYRGSPLGMYDHALWRAKTFLKQHDIEFSPGLNEDLAATAVWGSQQVGMFPGAKVDGVFGIWYGKGPGVDRSVDALKHANSAGTSPNGGVIALAGDDHGCQSSTLAHQSEQVFAAALMPVVNPATLQDYLDLGILGFALSRYSGCWVGFKAISETVESSASIVSDPDRIKIITPDDFEMPPGGLSIRWPDAPMEQERRLHGPKMQAVAAFARANRFDRIVLDFEAGAARHHGDRQGLSRSAAGAGRSRHIGRRGAGAGTAHLQGRADLAAGRIRRAGVCRRAAGRSGGRGEARLHRGPAPAHSLQRRCVEAALGGRQARRDRRHAAAERGRVDADHGGGGDRRAPAQARPPQPRAGAASRQARSFRPAGGRRRRRQAAAHAVFLLGLPAQHLDQDPRGQPRDGRHRLPRHGALGAEPPDAYDLAYGRGGRHLDRAGAVHQRSSTCSRIWATAPIPIPACWRSARRLRPASTSPTRSSTTTRSR